MEGKIHIRLPTLPIPSSHQPLIYATHDITVAVTKRVQNPALLAS